MTLWHWALVKIQNIACLASIAIKNERAPVEAHNKYNIGLRLMHFHKTCLILEIASSWFCLKILFVIGAKGIGSLVNRDLVRHTFSKMDKDIFVSIFQIQYSIFHPTTIMPYSSSVCPLSQKIRITSLLTVFLKHGQMDLSKASNSIFHHLTSIFPEKWVGGLVGLGGSPAWVSRPERPKGAKDDVGARRAPN